MTKSLILFLVVAQSTLAFTQRTFREGCYAGSYLAAHYLIQFNQDSTFNYFKRAGLSVDRTTGTYRIENELIKLEYAYVEPDSAYLFFTDSLGQKDSTFVELPNLSLRMKRPSKLYLNRRGLFFHPIAKQKEARRSKFYLKLKPGACTE